MKNQISFFIYWTFIVFVFSSCNGKHEHPKGIYYYTNGKQIYDTNQLAFLKEEENYEELTSDFQPKLLHTKTSLNQSWLLTFNKSMKIYRDSIYENYCARFPEKKYIIDSIKRTGFVSSCLLYVINNKTKEIEHFSINGRVNKNFKDLEIRNSRLIGTLAAFENGKNLNDNCYKELLKVRKNKGMTMICPNKSLERYFNFGSGGGSICHPPYSYLNWIEILKCNKKLKSHVNIYTLQSNYKFYSTVTTDVNAELNLFMSLHNHGKIFYPKVLLNGKKRPINNQRSFKKSTYLKMKLMLNRSMIQGRGAHFFLKNKIFENCWITIKSIDNFNTVLIYSTDKYTILIVDHSFLDLFFKNHDHLNFNTVNLLQLILKEMNLDKKKGKMYFKAKEYQKEMKRRNTIEL